MERLTLEPVRWGVLGAAGIARRAVIPAMQRSKQMQVVAIASRDIVMARAAAAAHSIPSAFGAYDELLADPSVEAVYIPLPNHLHVPWSIRAAEAGKHVLCEKPIALNAGEARQLIAVRERTGVQIAEAFMVRAHPRWLAVRELVGSGRIGALRSISGHFSYNRRDPADIRNVPEWGGGALLDIGCYPTTLSRWLYGVEPQAVIATLDRDPDTGVDRLVSALLRFPSGDATFTAGGQMVAWQRMQLFGERGRIDVEIPFTPGHDQPTRIFLDDGRDIRGGAREVIAVAAADQYLLQGEAFSRAVRGAGGVAVPLEDSIANMAVLDAIVRSANSGRWESPGAA